MARGFKPRGHLGFCHYEHSEVIQKQVLLAKRLLLSLRSIAMTRVAWQVADKCRTSKQITSTTPQEWLVAGSHLGFAKKSFLSIASDKNRAARFAMTRGAWQVRGQEVRASRGQVTGKNCVASVLGMEAR